MSNLFDFERFSTFVGGVVDRKVKALSMSITSSVGFLKSLVVEASGYATIATNNAVSAQTSSANASNSAAQSMSAYQSFTATYGGVKANEPTNTALNGNFNTNAFYIRSSDSRLRYAVSVTNGVVTWSDATVAADVSSVIAAADGVFLKLDQDGNQEILGPTNFLGAILVPRVTAWESQQPTPAIDVNNMISSLQQSLNNEIQRAMAAEANNSGSGDANQLNLNGEIQRATNAENSLGGRIDSVVSQRNIDVTNLNNADASNASAISGVQQNLNNEVQRAQGAEAALGARIDGSNGSVSTETTRAQAAEGSLSTSITSVSNYAAAIDTDRRAVEAGLNGRIDQEVSDRYNGDQAVQTNLNNEISRAQGAEASLSGSITAVSNYAGAVDTARQSAESGLGGRIDSEVSARGSEISRVDGRINQEQTDRSNGDSAVQGNLNSEISRAQGAEAGLNSRIDGKVDWSTYNAQGADSQNVQFGGGLLVKFKYQPQNLPEGANLIYFDNPFPNTLLGVTATLQKVNASGNILSYWEHDISTQSYFVFVLQDTEGSGGGNGVTYIAWGN